MRILVVIVLSLAVLTAAGSAAAASYGPPAQAYAVTATATTDGRMTGSQTITFGNSTGTPITEVWLRLWANGDGCEQRHITVSGLTGGSIAPPDLADTVLCNSELSSHSLNFLAISICL